MRRLTDGYRTAAIQPDGVLVVMYNETEARGIFELIDGEFTMEQVGARLDEMAMTAQRTSQIMKHLTAVGRLEHAGDERGVKCGYLTHTTR